MTNWDKVKLTLTAKEFVEQKYITDCSFCSYSKHNCDCNCWVNKIKWLEMECEEDGR